MFSYSHNISTYVIPLFLSLSLSFSLSLSLSLFFFSLYRSLNNFISTTIILYMHQLSAFIAIFSKIYLFTIRHIGKSSCQLISLHKAANWLCINYTCDRNNANNRIPTYISMLLLTSDCTNISVDTYNDKISNLFFYSFSFIAIISQLYCIWWRTSVSICVKSA